MATIINGKEVSAKVKEQVAEEVKQLKEKGIHLRFGSCDCW